MHLTAAILCDAANVREGLLNVLSGGVSVVNRPSYPNLVGVQLAGLLSADDPAVANFVLEVQLLDADEHILGSTRLSGSPIPDQPVSEGPGMLPMVIPLPFVLPQPGRYTIRVRLDGSESVDLPLQARTEGEAAQAARETKADASRE